MTLPERLAAYNTPEGALEYLDEYEKAHRKLSDKRERRLLEGYFERIGQVDTILDLPCGFGRYLPFLSRHGKSVAQSDWSKDMLVLGRKLYGEDAALGRFRALGHQMPLADGTVEVSFSMRLNHHLVDPLVRRGHIEELFRISSRWTIFSYFDYNSLKNLGRRVRYRCGSTIRRKNTMLRREVHHLARTAGFKIVCDPMLFVIGSGHRLVLAERSKP